MSFVLDSSEGLRENLARVGFVPAFRLGSCGRFGFVVGREVLRTEAGFFFVVLDTGVRALNGPDAPFATWSLGFNPSALACEKCGWYEMRWAKGIRRFFLDFCLFV